MAEIRKAILNESFKPWANEFLFSYDGGII